MVPKARRVRWSQQSRQERSEIFNYWNKRNKSTNYSKKLQKLFQAKMLQIAESPTIGRMTQTENVYTVIVRDHILIYEIYPQEIVVISVWEAHQNPENFDY